MSKLDINCSFFKYIYQLRSSFNNNLQKLYISCYTCRIWLTTNKFWIIYIYIYILALKLINQILEFFTVAKNKINFDLSSYKHFLFIQFSDWLSFFYFPGLGLDINIFNTYQILVIKNSKRNEVLTYHIFQQTNHSRKEYIFLKSKWLIKNFYEILKDVIFFFYRIILLYWQFQKIVHTKWLPKVTHNCNIPF